MRKILIVALAFLTLLGSVEVASAQMKRSAIKRNNHRMYTYRGRKKDFKDKEYSMVGLTLNALNYYGDLAPKPSAFSTNILLTRPAVGFVFAHRFGPRYVLTSTFTYGGIRGSDNESADKNDENGSFRYNRNLSFRNRIKELSVVASIDLWENMATYVSRMKWTPYAFAGLALFHHNPQAKAPAFGVDGVTPLAEAGEWVSLRRLGTEGQYGPLRPTDVNAGIKPYELFQIAIPFGVGARFKAGEMWDFSVEFGFRYLFTDYLDDVSRHYVDLGAFGDRELAKAMSYRTNELSNIQSFLVPVTSAFDNRTYNVLPGYGSEGKWNQRGDRGDNDTYMLTTLKATYILKKNYKRAKFR